MGPPPSPLEPTSPTATLPAADIWLTLSELSTSPREKLRPNQRLRLRLNLRCSTTPTDARDSSTTSPTPTVTPLSTPDTPGASTSLLTTTSDTGTSTVRGRLRLSPRLMQL